MFNRKYSAGLPAVPLALPSFRWSSPEPQADKHSFSQPANPDRQYSDSFYRIQQRLITQSVATDAIIYLLQSENEIFQAYHTLCTNGEQVFVSVRSRRLNLLLTPGIWDDLKVCSANAERWQLVYGLPSLIGADHWLLQRPLDRSLSPLQATFRDTTLSRSSSTSSYLRYKSSNTSASARSRKESFTTIDSETDELISMFEPTLRRVPKYTCPLVAHGQCREIAFKRLGNCKNHVMRAHRWYTDEHPDWANEISIRDQYTQELTKPNSIPQPSPRPHTSNDMIFFGMGSSDPVATMATFHIKPPQIGKQSESSYREDSPPVGISRGINFDDLFKNDALITDSRDFPSTPRDRTETRGPQYHNLQLGSTSGHQKLPTIYTQSDASTRAAMSPITSLRSPESDNPPKAASSPKEATMIVSTGPEAKTQSHCSSSDGEVSFAASGRGMHELRPFDERVEQRTQDFILQLAESIVVECRRFEEERANSKRVDDEVECSTAQLGTELQHLTPIANAHGCESNDHGASSSSTAASSVRVLGSGSNQRTANKRALSEDGEEDHEKHRKRPTGSSSSEPTSVCTRKLFLACPYYKHDPLRYSSNNFREKEYRGCSSSFLQGIHRLKQHLYRVHKRPAFSCSRCSETFKSQELLDVHTRQDPPCMVVQQRFPERMDHSQFLAIKRRQVGGNTRELWYHIFRILFPDAPEPDSPYTTGESTDRVRSEVQHLANLFRHVGPDVMRRMLNDRQQLVQRNELPPLDILTFELVEETFAVAFPLYQQVGVEDLDTTVVVSKAPSHSRNAEGTAAAVFNEGAATSDGQPLVPLDRLMDGGHLPGPVGAEDTPPEELSFFDDFLQFTNDATEACANFDPFGPLMYEDEGA